MESLFSQHFGRTPASTPYASQELSSESDQDSSSADEDIPAAAGVDDRVRKYIDSIDQSDVDELSTDEEDCHQNDLGNVQLDLDDPDAAKIRHFRTVGCGCKYSCSSKLSEHAIFSHILDTREMSKEEKDAYVIGSLIENAKDTTKRGNKRKRTRHEYKFEGHKICKKAFMLIFDVGKRALQNLKDHKKSHGLTPRKHGNTGRTPHNALNYETLKCVIQFISNYGDEFGLPQPAAPRGVDGIPVIYLPSDMTRKSIHAKYAESCQDEQPAPRAVKYSTFCNIWYQCLPHIKIAKPRDDVCATCEKLRKTVVDSVTEEEKLESLNNMKQHITNAQRERDVYNECVKRARETADLNEERFVHYTFDFSQSVALPHHSRQMGPVYFLSLRKVHIFGFRIDGTPKQLNFLINEDESIGQDGTCAHGPDSVISMIDWALATHGCGETKCTFHADNCGGQNKNKYVIGYFMWRVMTGQHEEITYMMQIPGHARCLIDGGFALLKKKYRRCDCESLDQLEDIVDTSSSTNMAVRYPDWQWRSWKNFLNLHFKAIKGIRKYHFFRFSSQEPGIVTVKETADSEEQKINILKMPGFRFGGTNSPEIIQPKGMSRARLEYLYNTVRPFVRPAFQDAICPRIYVDN